MNFGELKSDIRSYTEVDNTVLSDPVLTTIVKNAEARIFRETDTDDARFYDTITLTPGNREVAAPANTRFIRYIYINDTNETPAVRKALEYRDTSFMEEYYNTPGTASPAPNNIPRYYSNRNATTIFVAPTPDAWLFDLSTIRVLTLFLILTLDVGFTFLSDAIKVAPVSLEPRP